MPGNARTMLRAFFYSEMLDAAPQHLKTVAPLTGQQRSCKASEPTAAAAFRLSASLRLVSNWSWESPLPWAEFAAAHAEKPSEEVLDPGAALARNSRAAGPVQWRIRPR